MALTQTQVSQLYVAIFNRASEGSGNAFWQAQSDMAAAATEMLATSDAQEYFGDSLDTDQAFIEHIYSNTLNKTVEDDEDGIAYWVGLLEDGATRGEVVAGLVAAVESYGPDGENYDPEDEATVVAYNQFTNRVEVSNYMAENVEDVPEDYAQVTGFDKDLVVTDDVATVISAKAAVDELAIEPPVIGDDFFMTADQDIVDGTADNDTFYADVVQVGGPQVNSLGTGDRVDGKAGMDSMEAQVTEGLFMGGFNMAIQPRIKDVEDIKLEAMQADMYWAEYENSDVYVNAKNIYGVDAIWSWYSDANLVVQDVNTMTAEGDHDIARNTSEMTIGMGYTANTDTRWQESDMHVYFDQDFLLTGESAESKAIFYLLDQDAELFDKDPDGDGVIDLLADINTNGLRFTVDGGETLTIQFDKTLLENDTVITHEDFVAALQDSLDALIAAGDVPADTILYLDPTLTDFTFLDDGSRSSDIPAMVLETQTDHILDAVGFKWFDDEQGEYNVYGRIDEEADVEDDPLSVQVALEKVGRGGEGGELIIGSMDKYNYGIEEFHVTVYGDDGRPSSLSDLDSTGGALDKIYITSDNEGFPGDTWADLTIGNDNSVGNVLNEGMSLVKSNGFMGDLSLGTATARVEDLKALDTTDMAGDTTFWAEMDAKAKYSYETGSGDDTLNVVLDGDAVDTIDTGLAIDTAAGDDTVKIAAEVATPQTGVSQLTMLELGNLAIDTSAGDDKVEINNNFRFYVDAGAGSDFVYINSQDATLTGAWVVSTATGPSTFVDRALYQAKLTVTFAGFESTVAVDTDAEGNFVADQITINNAIIAAIDASPELKQLLKTTKGTADQQLTITSLVDGANELSIDLFQPQLVAAGVTPVAGQVSLVTADAAPLLAGIVETDAAEDSDTNPITYMNANQGSLNADGTVGTAGRGAKDSNDFQEADAGGSADATGVANVNFSIIDMGDGANDLVVLDSNDNSANILVIDQTFGKVSVVNFFDDADLDVVGNHAIDFTEFLDNVTSATESTLSQVPVPVTLNGDNVAEANSVSLMTLVQTADDKFVDLTAAKLLTALNGEDADDDYANITNNTLDAVDDTTDLVGKIQNHIVMVENASNPGEYKVFHLTSEVDEDDGTDGEFASAVELGTLDFGNSINFGLVGNPAWEAEYADLIAAADGAAPIPGDDDDDDDDDDDGTVVEVNATTAADALDADGDDFTFDITSGDYDQEIINFAAGDVLDFPDGNTPTVVNTDFTDGIVEVVFTLDPVITTIELTGLDAAVDAQLLGVASFDAVFGEGTII
jgi:hypothetical protein